MISIDRASCVGCGLCVRGCSMGYLRLNEGHAEIRERRRCIACGHCAAICPKRAVTLRYEREEDFTPAPENELERLLLMRRSVRHFKPEPPPRAVIERALNLAEYAPSGKNYHAHRWTVLYGLERANEMVERALDFCARTGEARELLKIKAAGTNLLTCDAPCVIIAWSPDDALNPVVDPVVAMEQVELMLNQAGVSTCWGGYLRQVSDADPELRAYLGIPEGCHLRCALMAGYADREKYVRIPPRTPAKVNWME
ncbi:MAG: nitroreductase family protein [Oscillospiraceae bacterium]|nr:nitroreductase family protein [Oscillospiraceae bacterium]